MAAKPAPSSPRPAERYRAIDPFGAHPELASRVTGLGGTQQAEGGGYVFKTPSFAAGDGLARIQVVFEGLVATTGHLIFEIANESRFPETPALRLRLTGIDFAELAAAGGVFTVEVSADPNTRYAIGGHAANATDAAADAIRVTLEAAREAGDTVRRQRAAGRPAERAIDDAPRMPSPLVGTDRLVAHHEPSFARLTSQPSTPGQLVEPDFLSCASALGSDPLDPTAWAEAFVLQATRLYATAKVGRRALAMGVQDSALPAALAAAGWKVLVVGRMDDPGEQVDLGELRRRLARPALCSAARFEAVDMCVMPPETLPASRRGGFDCAWAILSSAAAPRVARTLDVLSHALRPGGIAAVTCRYGVGDDHDTEGGMSRRDAERTALNLIAQGLEVMQLCFPSSAVASTGYFGFLLRRPR